MNRFRLALAGLLLGSTLTIGFAQGGVTAESGDVIVPQAHCADGEFELSGTVSASGGAYPTWVEYRYETDAMQESSGPWLSDAGRWVDTDSEGNFSLCVPNQMEFDGVAETMTRVQVLAYPDLTTWDGSSAPAVGLTAGNILEASTCTGGCTSNISMSPPTVWADSTADFFFVFSDEGYVTYLPAYRPASASTVDNSGKMAAAYPFATSTSYQVRGNVDSSGNPLDDIHGFSLAFSRNLTTDGDGILGVVAPPNFYADLNFPPGLPEPEQDESGMWPDNSWANVFMFRLSQDDGCSENFLGDQSCRQPFDQYEPLKFSSDLSSGVPYVIAASAGILPISYRIIFLTADGDLLYAPTIEAFSGGATDSVEGPLTSAAPFVLDMDPPTFLIGSTDSDSLVPGVTMHAEKWDDTECGGQGCFRYLPGEQPSNGGNGVFGWNPSAGVWTLATYPVSDFEFSEEGPNWARTAHYVKVEVVEGTLTISATCSPEAVPTCDGSPPPQNDDGVWTFGVDRANVIVNVIGLDGQPVAWQSIEVGPAESEWSDYGSPTTETGQAGLNLEPGEWKVIARPPEGDLDQAAGRLVFTVESSHTSATPLFVTVSLSEPNVKGRVLKPDNTTSRFSGVQVQVFDEAMNGPRNIRWASTNLNGEFAINLGEGTYKLTLDPPPSNQGLPRTSFFIKVDSSGVPCLVSDFADTECDESTPVDHFVFVFASPNFSGRLLLDSGAGVSGWVNADAWNGMRFDWSDIGAQIDSSGNFALVLDENTTYRIVAEPRASSGASRSTIYVAMGVGGLWCQTTADPITETPATCTPASTGTLTIQAPGANFRGSVSTAGSSITQGWVDASVETEFGWRYFEGAQVKRDGTFALRIDRPGSEWQQVKVTVNPPWGSSSLVKKTQVYWVLGTDICADVERPNSECSSPVTQSDVQAFVLTGGNVTGVVTMPETGDAAAFVHISVETQNADGWWEWVDVWAQTDVNGVYSLGLEDGTYRITARPFNRDGVAPTSIYLTVDATCTECGAADINLAPPNVTATIRVPGGASTVSGAWVGVEKKKVNCRNGDCSESDVWWEWTGLGAESNDEGLVAISVPVTDTSTDYRLVVHGPWSGQVIYPRFTSDEFTLVNGGATEQQFGPLDFPSANVEIVLMNGDDTVANSWVGIEMYNGQYWQWLDVGSHTGASGKVSLYLPCLADDTCDPVDYRVVVDSPWGASTALPRFTKSLSEVLDTALLDDFHPISFPDSNVSGRVMIDENTANRNGWLEVFEWGDLDDNPVTPDEMGSWLTGNPVNRQGQFAMFLEDGTYLLRAHPNGRIAATAIEVIIVVANGEFSSCFYTRGGPECSRNDFDIDLSFAERPKNLSLTVTYNGQPLTRSAFVTLESASEGVSISLVTDETGTILATVPVASDYSISVVLPTGGSNVVNGSLTDQFVGSDYGDDRTAITVEL